MIDHRDTPSADEAAGHASVSPTRRAVLRGSLGVAAGATATGSALAPSAYAAEQPPAPADPSAAGPAARHWQTRLDALAARHQVPGAALGILSGNRVTKIATGMANVDDRIEATPDTVWQIGSVTKVWTATVAMRLVDEGLLDLDTPVTRVMPELRLSDPERTARLTLRHLLTHTSGIDGDVLTDTGRGDDCLERYAALLGGVRGVHPLGRVHSYCNAGLMLTGRLIERVTGTTWDAALHDRLLKPLGLTRTHTLPEDVLAHRAAAGHTWERDRPPHVNPAPIPRSSGPAGIVCSSVEDVLTFARLHLDDGRGPDGTRILSSRSAEAMRSRWTDTPDTADSGETRGLGWARWDWNGRTAYGHDGTTHAQASFLRILPDARIAVVLLTNGGDNAALHVDLFREIFTALAHVAPRPQHTPDGTTPPRDAGGYLGRYPATGIVEEVLERDGALYVRRTFEGRAPSEFRLLPAGRDLYVHRVSDTREWQTIKFFTLDGTRYLYRGGRVVAHDG
ncbi:serine hydrolase domain-containing protein [Embleya scabrispora]|uniref:serine hydrolase domain-containing protein n=1 Tax=Embleya scabrispora TaxID=159449 RepID=UPI000C7AE8BD|nr:serine hydrolase domain-containing protein [Embleya scabrispora]